MAELLKNVRSYEISVWTLQDECITILKPSELEFKGEVQNPNFVISDDGTEELNFSIPMYYRQNGELILNPAWQYILDGHFTANLHKVKLILNKATEDEKVYELLIVNVVQKHDNDHIIYDISCEGLAFHELGKLGYKISLSSEEFQQEYSDWFDRNERDSNDNLIPAPRANIQYWNDKIFKHSDGTLKYAWDYEIQMDWSSYSDGANRDPHIVYEEEYVSSWNVNPFDYTFSAKSVEGNKEKWRQLDELESNIYNLTQTVAEKFGVFCRYEYTHDANYHIIGRKVIYYNSSFKEQEGYIDLTYPYSASEIQRTVDSTETITKLFVRPIESDSSSTNLITITSVDGNPSKEDYLLNFDYLHDIHTITDEQYALVKKYEAQLREINEQAVMIESEIQILEEELVKVRADYTTYTNAIKLDIERENNANLLYQQLTGTNEYITIDAGNPRALLLRKQSGTSDNYYVEMPFQGILPETVNLYTTLNQAAAIDQGRLDGLITSGDLQYDEFGDLNKIINIYLPMIDQSHVYLTCSYSPKLYYKKVIDTWKSRLASDTANQKKSNDDIRSIEIKLYGADLDYCHSDYAAIDAASIEVSTAVDDLREYIDGILYYDLEKSDFNARMHHFTDTQVTVYREDTEGKRIATMLTHQAYIPEVIAPVYGLGMDANGRPMYNIITPVLPDSSVIRTYINRRWNYDEAKEIASKFVGGGITLDTPVVQGKIYTFRDIYLGSVLNEEEAIRICDNICNALRVYDEANANTANSLKGYGTTDYTYSNFGYLDKGIIGEANAYYAWHEYLMLKKQKIIAQFEKDMGPALREGYWQADDYNDYGNKYSDQFALVPLSRIVYGQLKPDLINFCWDNVNVFSGETTSYYEVGAQQTRENYMLVDLSPYLDRLINYMDNLCFIYYDKTFLGLNDAIDAKEDELNTLAAKTNRSSEEELLYEYLVKQKNYVWDDARKHNIESAKHWMVIDSQCEFGYIWDETKGYKPVLILLESKELLDTQRDSILNPKQGFEPFLGTVVSKVVTTRDSSGKQISYVESTTTSIMKDDEKLVFVTGSTTAFPRIRINSLELKNNSDDILISINGQTLTYIEDYSVFMRNDEQDHQYKYLISIKPKVLINCALGSQPIIKINYATSNAGEALYLDALKVMKENAYPKVSYNVKLNVLNKNMIRTAYNKLRSIIHINDYELQLDKVSGYISKLTLDLDNPQNDTAEIKNYETKFEDLFSTIVAQSESMKKNENTISIAAAAFQPNGMIYSSVLQDSLLKADLSYSFNQGKLTITENEGIWGISDSGVVAFRGGGIFTATEKTADGEWNWNTGILPTGINADLITSGQLNTDRIRIYAGDKVAFQMNGEGIFAYKTLAADQQISLSEEKYRQYISGIVDTIDALQYVQMNENGLFLVAKNGAKYLTREHNDFGTVNVVGGLINRVEISWDGLKLRDWEGNNTLWADPDTGNLNMIGRITALEGGSIGGWNITETGLESDYIRMVSDKNNTNNNGIFLTDKASGHASMISYNGNTYYACTIPSLDPNRIYYSRIGSSEHTTGNLGETLLTYNNVPTTVRPIEVLELDEEMEVTTGYIVDNTDKPEIETMILHSIVRYLGNGAGYFLTYGDNQKIPYNGSDSLNSDWYHTLTTRFGNNADTYVVKSYTSQLQEVVLGAGITIVLDEYQPTFSVKAMTGEVQLNTGQLGPFTLTRNSLSGLFKAKETDETFSQGILRDTIIADCDLTRSYVTTSIDNVNYYYSLRNYSNAVIDVVADTDAGTLTFTKVNGDVINFNIADMQYYKQNISAAQIINGLNVSISNNGTNSKIAITAKTNNSNIGTYFSRSETYNLGHIWQSGYDSGWSDGYAAGGSGGGGGGGSTSTTEYISNNAYTHAVYVNGTKTGNEPHSGYNGGTCSLCGQSGIIK